jgi:hypothetical protein
MPGFSAVARVSRLKLFGGSWANRYLKKKTEKNRTHKSFEERQE